jgi:hypothetical protein
VPTVVFDNMANPGTWTQVYGSVQVGARVTHNGSGMLWEYQVKNVDFNLPRSGSTVLPYAGLFAVYLPDVDPPEVYGTSASIAWPATVGFHGGAENAVCWQAPENGPVLGEGQTATFSFFTSPFPVGIVGGEMYNPGYAIGVNTPTAGPGASILSLDFSGQSNADKKAGVARKIHINDNFDEGQQTATALVSDHLADPVKGFQIKDGDADLANATLTINYPNVGWTLEWTIDPGVKVWYKEWLGPNAGKWCQAADMASLVNPLPALIELRVEGNDIKAGSIKVKLTAGLGGGSFTANDTIKFDVYTGLKVTGLLSGQFRDQIQQATAYTVTSDGAGNVWRTGAAKGSPGWQMDARGYLNPIFESSYQTALKADADVTVKGDSWNLAQVDPEDLAVQFAPDQRFGAGMVVHVLVEQYQKQVLLESDYDKAHDAASRAEAKVVAGGGTRGEKAVKRVGPGNIYDIEYSYDGGIIATFVMDRDNQSNFSNVFVRRP